MKNALVYLLILWTLPASALAADWTGKTVLVPENALICDQLYLEKAMDLLSAGDKDSIIDYLEKHYCTISPDPFYATVNINNSSTSDYPMVEIVVEGASGWLAKSNTVCCFTQQNDEWVKEIPDIPEWKKACTPQETIEAFLDYQKQQGFPDAPRPPPEMAPLFRCPGEY